MSKKERTDYELLAPVGSYASLEAAAHAGADAIYFGIEQLNMRSRSSANFTADDLSRIVSLSKEYGLACYLTVNTVIFNHELIQMRKIIDRALEEGITAIIASDQSVLQYCNSIGAKVHLSTQLNISNIETLKFYSGFADVAVLARELDLEQVKEISDGIALEDIRGQSGKPFRIEIFVHGALCMATSGKCYLSLHEHNHSANRGDCFQVCRRGYRVTDKDREVELDIDNEYIMSPKDLKTIHFLNKVLDAGVSILKIEGRARSADYVKTVTTCYNEAIHAYVDGRFSRELIDDWDARLATVFNRGFWDGYYLGQRLGEWSEVYGSRATQKKVYVGKVTNFYSKIGVAEVLMETGTIKLGDDLLIIGSTSGVREITVGELRVDEKNVDSASRGVRVSLPVNEGVRRSDKVYLLESTS